MGKDNNKGWIKIHRAIKDWMKDKSPSTVKVYIYLLASVNVRPKKFNWGVCGSGETFVSQNTLSKELNLSVNTIRKALAELERGGEIKRVVIDQNHIKIIVPKFDNYQFGGISKNDTPSKIDISKNDIGVYQKLTPNKNIYNKNMVVDVNAHTHEEKVQSYLGDEITLERFCMAEHITPQQFRELVSEVLTEWELTSETDQSKRHMINAMRSKAQAKRKAKATQSKAEQRKEWEDNLMRGAMQTINEIYKN